MIYTSAKALDTLIREIGESTTDCTIKSDKKQKPNYSRDEISKRLEFAGIDRIIREDKRNISTLVIALFEKQLSIVEQEYF